MPLPANVATCTVSGTFVNIDGSIPTGTVTFQPVPYRVADGTSSPAPTMMIGKQTVHTLDVNGHFSCVIPATDDADLNPTAFSYNVRVRLDSGSYTFDMLAPAGTVDLTTVTPIVPTDGDITGGTTQGLPPGGTAGQVLAKLSAVDYAATWVPASVPGVHAATHAAGSTDPVALTGAQVAQFSSLVRGTVPASGGGTTNFLRADGTWNAPAGGAGGGYTPGGTDVAITDGGTGQSTKAAGFNALSPMTTAGDLIIGGAAGAGTRLAKGADGQILSLVAGAPVWAANAGGGGGGTLTDGDKGDVVVSGSGSTWVFDPTVVTTAAKTVLDDTTTAAMLTTLGAAANTAFTTSTAGIVPTPGGTSSGRFLKDDGTWTLAPSAASGAGNVFPFMLSATATEPPTGSQIRGNNATFTSSTKLWIMETTVDGLDVSVGLARIKAGFQVYVQDYSSSARYAIFNVTADAVDKGVYWELAVVLSTSLGTIPAGKVALQSLSSAQAGNLFSTTTTAAGLAPGANAAGAGAWLSGAGTWTAPTKTTVGLSAVDNTSDATKNAATATLTNKTIAFASNTITGLVANVQGVAGIWTGTQAAYDAIGTKTPTTLYFIT